MNYDVTKDTSILVETKGYWSGKAVYFNTSTNKIIVLDKSIQLTSIVGLINEYLEENLISHIEEYIKSILLRSNEKLSEGLKNSRFKSYFNLQKVSRFNRNEFKCRSGYVTWKSIADWLSNNCIDEQSQIKTLAEIFSKSIQMDEKIITADKNIYSLCLLRNILLRDLLSHLNKNNISIEKSLSIIATFAFDIKFERHNLDTNLFNERNYDIFESIKAFNIPIGYVNTGKDIRLLKAFCSSCSILLGLLCSKRIVILPSCIQPGHLVGLYKELMALSSLLKDTSSAKFTRKTFLHRLMISSNITSILDMPYNISELVQHIIESNLINSTFSPMLSSYAETHDLTPFPIQTLNRLKAKRNKRPHHYSLDWLRERKLPNKWLIFAERLIFACNSSDPLIRALTRSVISWAWFEQGFQSPSEIKITDIRDPKNPNKEGTFYKYIKNSDAKGKSTLWGNASRAFKLVQNYGYLQNEHPPLIHDNPFQHLSNPFKEKSKSATHRQRIPTNIHEAMLHVLLSPDNDGNPTYSFVRDELKWDWYDKNQLNEKKPEYIWCPSRARLVALMLILPVRGKQARWLDQGLMDHEIWDTEKEEYVINNHELKNWCYPNGKTHLEVYKRPSGVLQPIQNSLIQDNDQLCIYVSTNKTQMWDPECIKGYEIWWPKGDELHKGDIVKLVKQANYLDRPYEIITSQLKWLKKYDSKPCPITFSDTSEDSKGINKSLSEEYPYFTPIFRDMTSKYYKEDGTEYNPPVSKQKIERLFNALAFHTEKILHDQKVNVSLTIPSNNTSSRYEKRSCIYDLHSLRVYGVSYLIELGIPYHIVQMIVGHTAPTMTLHYNKQTPDFIRSLILEKVSKSDLLDSWGEIKLDVMREKKFITINSGFHINNIPNDLLLGDYLGFVQKPGGLCPLGGTACNIGQVLNTDSIGNEKNKVSYVPVDGGCGNCRFFCTTPAHLVQHQMIINELFILIRSVGKKQHSYSETLSSLQWDKDEKFNNEYEISTLKSQIEEIERQLEPLVREWMNRVQMALQTIDNLDEYLSVLKENSNNIVPLLSTSTSTDLLPQLELRMEKTGEFELARQTLLAAHLQGGIDYSSELSRSQMREFMDRIMIHENPQLLLLNISDEKTKDKVAFITSEIMASIVGPHEIQNSLDNSKGLNMNENNKNEFNKLIEGIFNNAKNSNSSLTFESLLPDKFNFVNDIN